MAVERSKARISITTKRVTVLVFLNLFFVLHYFAWHHLEMRTWGRSDPTEFFDFFKTGIIKPFTILFLAVSVATLFLGRSFCGWFCHMGSWQDGARYLVDRKWKWLKPLHAWGVLILPVLCLAVLLYGIVNSWIHVGFPEKLSLQGSTAPVLDIPFMDLVTSIFLLVLINQAFFGSRAICRFLCPLGLWLKFFDYFSKTRVRNVKTDPCTDCLECNRHCRMGVDVNYQINRFGEVKDLQCVKCGTCTTYCPEEKLKLTLWPLKHFSPPLYPEHPPNEVRWIWGPYEIIMHAVAVTLIGLYFSELMKEWDKTIAVLCVSMVATYLLFLVIKLLSLWKAKFYKTAAKPHKRIAG